MTASLQALVVGTLTLNPAFDPNVLSYTTDTTNATSKVTATPVRSGAKVTIMNGETPVQSGGTATWSEGENTLTVTVENGTTKRAYTVTVNKGAAG